MHFVVATSAITCTNSPSGNNLETDSKRVFSYMKAKSGSIVMGVSNLGLLAVSVMAAPVV